MSLIDLVFCSDEHLNHLLANVKSIRFRPKQINSQTAAKVKKTIMAKNNGPLSICYPLKDSNFGNDISSERSKQMICKELKKQNKKKQQRVKPLMVEEKLQFQV